MRYAVWQSPRGWRSERRRRRFLEELAIALDREPDAETVADVRRLAARYPGEAYAATAMAAILMPIDRGEANAWLMRREVQEARDPFDLAQAASLLVGVDEPDLAEEFLARTRGAVRGRDVALVEDIAIRVEGWIASARGDLEEAERKLRLYMDRNPDEAFAASDLVWFLDNVGRVDEALALLETGGPVVDPEHLHRIRERTLARHPEYRALR